MRVDLDTNSNMEGKACIIGKGMTDFPLLMGLDSFCKIG